MVTVIHLPLCEHNIAHSMTCAHLQGKGRGDAHNVPVLVSLPNFPQVVQCVAQVTNK